MTIDKRISDEMADEKEALTKLDDSFVFQSATRIPNTDRLTLSSASNQTRKDLAGGAAMSIATTRPAVLLNRRKHRRVIQALTVAGMTIAVLPVLGSVSSAASTPPAGYGEGSGFCASAVPGGYTLPKGGPPSSFDDVYACGPANNT